MDFEEVLNNRRSIRLYKKKLVERDKIYQIINAASLAPSAGNLQSWNFILVDDIDVKNQIVTAAMQQDWILNAQIIVVCSRPSNTKRFYGTRGEVLYTVQDCAAAIQNMLLEASNLGLGSCWIGAFEENALSRILKLPEEVRPQAIITIGYSDESPVIPKRYAIESLVFHDEYGKRIVDEGFGVMDTSAKSKTKINKGGIFDIFRRKWKKE